MSYLRLIGRILIAALFLYSGYQKVSVPLENFEEVLRAYEIFPEFSILFLSRFVPYAELGLGTFLLLGLLTRFAFLGALAFFGTFILVLGRALILQIPIEDCGCFGAKIHSPLFVTLGMDIGFFLLTLWLLFSKPTPFRIDSLIFQKD